MAGLRSLVSRANQGLGLRLDFVWPVEPNGDHHTFLSHQTPVVMFHTGLHDQYHRPSDDADFINANGLEEVSQLVFSTLAEAAESPLSSFRNESRQEGQLARKAFERPLPPPQPRLGLSWSATSAESGGLRVTSVQSDSPADQAGIRVGDVLLQFNGQPTTNSETLQRAVLQSEAEVTVRVQREESTEPVTLPVRLAGARVRLGLSWRENSGEPGTVTVIRVVPHSPADAAGLRLGDRIHRLGGQSFSDSHQFGALARSTPLPLEMQIEREGQLQTITLP